VKIVVALGGNALLRRGERPGIEVQRANLERAAQSIAPLAREHAIVVTHGNGPQVGWLALQAQTLAGRADAAPLDVLDAESEGLLGYLIAQALQPHLPGRQVIALLTQVEVSRSDPAFAKPRKPIGPRYARARADRLARAHGWTFTQENDNWRRVVPSPEPLRILELPAIELLLASGAVVICAGGGGIPVEALAGGGWRGVEAVIDKDLASALLASKLRAAALLLLTDVEAVQRGWGTPQAQRIGRIAPAALRRLAFESGSMQPKVEAACRFVEAGGRLAAIGRPEDAASLLAGIAGTIVTSDPS